MKENKTHEIKNWRRIYIAVVVFLVLQILFYNLFTEYFK